MSLTMLPLIFFEKYIGLWVKKTGLLFYIKLGFLLLAFFCLLFILFHDLSMLLLFLFTLSCLGMAFIEPLKDVYFFKRAGKEKERFIGVYNATNPLSDILTPLLCSTILLIFNSFLGIWALGIFFFMVCYIIADGMKEP